MLSVGLMKLIGLRCVLVLVRCFLVVGFSVFLGKFYSLCLGNILFSIRCGMVLGRCVLIIGLIMLFVLWL